MMSIVFGLLAIFMPSIYLFAICRFLTAFGSIGYNIIYTIQVELIGIRHRSFSTILNHFGWGLGVICVPLVDHLLDDYRAILSIAPILSLVM
jgi:MFS family permease